MGAREQANHGAGAVRCSAVPWARHRGHLPAVSGCWHLHAQRPVNGAELLAICKRSRSSVTVREHSFKMPEAKASGIFVNGQALTCPKLPRTHKLKETLQ